MGEFKKQSVSGEVPKAEVPHPPKTCTFCGLDTVVLRVVVYDDRGTTHYGAFSQFGDKKAGHMKLREPYTFCRWESWCTDHWAARKDKLKWTPALKAEWEKLGSPVGREACLKVLYKINPALAKQLGRRAG